MAKKGTNAMPATPDVSALAGPASMTVGPSAPKVLLGTVIVTILAPLVACALILFTACLGNYWPLRHAGWLVIGTAAAFAGFSGFAVLGSLLWARPRVEIGPDGFVTQGIVGRRPRRWSDIDGDFAVVRARWQRMVVYRLTDAFKASAAAPRSPPSLAAHDEAIVFCNELAIGAQQLADLLNQWKRGGGPSAPAVANSPHSL